MDNIAYKDNGFICGFEFITGMPERMSIAIDYLKSLNLIAKFVGFKALFGLIRGNRLFDFFNGG